MNCRTDGQSGGMLHSSTCDRSHKIFDADLFGYLSEQMARSVQFARLSEMIFFSSDGITRMQSKTSLNTVTKETWIDISGKTEKINQSFIYLFFICCVIFFFLHTMRSDEIGVEWGRGRSINKNNKLVYL